MYVVFIMNSTGAYIHNPNERLMSHKHNMLHHLILLEA